MYFLWLLESVVWSLFRPTAQVDSSGNPFLAGYTESDLDGHTNAGDNDIFLMKFEAHFPCFGTWRPIVHEVCLGCLFRLELVVPVGFNVQFSSSCSGGVFNALCSNVLSSFWFWSLWLSRTVALAYIVIEWKVSRVKWLMLSSYVQRVCGLRVGTGLDASVELVKVCMFNPSFWRCCLRSCLIVDKTRFGQIIKQ